MPNTSKKSIASWALIDKNQYFVTYTMNKTYIFKKTGSQSFDLLEDGQIVGCIRYNQGEETYTFEFKGIIVDLDIDEEFLAKEKALRILVRK